MKPGFMLRRILLSAAGVLLVVALVLAAAGYWYLSGDGVRIALESQATKWLGQRVTLGGAGARLFSRPRITPRGRRAGDPVRIMLGDVELSTGLAPLWSHRIEDAEVAIADSRIDMPLPFALPAPGERTAAPPSSSGLQVVSVRTIKLRNVTVASRGRQITVSADSSLSSAHLNLDRFTAASGKTSLEATGLVQPPPRLAAPI